MSNFWQTHNETAIGVGFGTAALGGNTYPVVQLALENGFLAFDTAEADWWYNQGEVGRSFQDFYAKNHLEDCKELQISTKIPPWSLTSSTDIRRSAMTSRQELIGFCDVRYVEGEEIDHPFMPLDVYYIHAPRCWSGWHPKCDNPPLTLELKDAWKAMEAVVGIDHTAKRVGLSNVHPTELSDIIHWVQRRIEDGETYPPPRIPDVLQAYADPIHTARELRQICEEHGIEFVSYSTLGTQHRTSSDEGNPVLTSLVVQRLAQKHQRSVAEVVLSWALQNNMSVIPRSSKKHHIEELSRLLTRPTFLEEDDLMAMDTLSSDYVGEL